MLQNIITLSIFFFSTTETTKTKFLYFGFINAFFVTQQKFVIKIRFFYIFKHKKKLECAKSSQNLPAGMYLLKVNNRNTRSRC